MNAEKAYSILKSPNMVFTNEESTQEDLSESFLIEEHISESNFFISKETRKNREIIFHDLKLLFQQWFSNISKNSNEQINLFAFGSFQMEIESVESDIDVVCVLPNSVKKDEDCFGLLPKFLKEDVRISDLLVVKDAHVPLIKFQFQEVSFDISFAFVPIEFCNKLVSNEFSNDLLNNLDSHSIRSFNGLRNAELILKSVPNLKNFQITIKFVKYWAKQKAIYSSLFGYLGGISWAILVAKICQLYPAYLPNRLLERFFFIYSNWNWKLEVRIMDEEITGNNHLNNLQWKAENLFCMNIITPAYPSTNSSHSVTARTLLALKHHFRQGHTQITQGNYRELFSKYNFFDEFSYFLQFTIYADNLEDFNIWKGNVENKIRKLTALFEIPEYQPLEIYFYPVVFYSIDEEHENSVSYFYGIMYPHSIETNVCIDIRNPIFTFLNFLDFSIQRKDTMNISTVAIQKKDLPYKIFSNNKTSPKIKPKPNTQIENANNAQNTMNKNQEIKKTDYKLKKKIGLMILIISVSYLFLIINQRFF